MYPTILSLRLFNLVLPTSQVDGKLLIQTCYTLLVKLATVVKGDPQAPFSIATTQRCRGGHYSIPWIAPLCP